MINEISEDLIDEKLLENKQDVVFVKLNFDNNSLLNNSPIKNNSFLNNTFKIIDKSTISLKPGGLLFVFGPPKYLPFISEYLNNIDSDFNYTFKYWIAVEMKEVKVKNGLPKTHRGVLMFLKSKKTKIPTPFHINTKEVRIPYKNCISCGDNLKDWGGKKHLMNPLGTAVSDVWKDFNHLSYVEQLEAIISRVYDLTYFEEFKFTIINQKEKIIEPKSNSITEYINLTNTTSTQLNKVINQDCIIYLDQLKKKNPNGTFNLAFADPPYNLSKNYSKYDDNRKDIEYIEWCNSWLNGMYENLLPGGSLFVLNIPKWALAHFNHLIKKMNFENWIIWDALSTPSGKILPAHYSLLHFSKPGGKARFSNQKINSREYCLRNSCSKSRKIKGDEKMEVINDFWWDVHRIKHKKDRDNHPCQLPVKLMDRIVQLYSQEGDVIYDPFGGAGTTAISAKVNGRNYLLTELDQNYYNISNSNLNDILTDSSGNLTYHRKTVKQSSIKTTSNKKIELMYFDLVNKQKKILTQELLKDKYSNLYELILNDYPKGFKYLNKIAKRRLETIQTIS